MVDRLRERGLGNRKWGDLYISLLLVIFGGMVLHAPLTVWLSSNFPDCSLFIKSWKEILMLIASFIAIYLLYKNKKFYILRNPLILAIIAYAALHIILLFINNQGLMPSLAGLIIDLRYLLFFVLVYVAIQLFPDKKDLFLKVGIAGALIVVIFAILQVFVLPYDVLKYIGYDKHTIIPYLLIDQNFNYIRINSTLRGPNPLGAYALIVLALVFSALINKKIKKDKFSILTASTLFIGGIVALWSSYSRSALVATLIAVSIILFLKIFKKISLKVLLALGAVAILISGTLYVSRGNTFISNIIFHENPANLEVGGSNDGHIGSLQDGLDRLYKQPLGAGVGSTGSASLLGDDYLVIESQYLMVAHETGWLGLAYFLSIYTLVLWQLWNKKKDWLSLGVFASGIGLAVIGLFLPVFADDTVSIVWWGLAGLVIGEQKNE